MMRKLIQQKVIDINAPDSSGNKALILASAMGHTSMVADLLAAGADKDTTFDDVTPLIVASWNGHDAVVDILLSAQPNINAKEGTFGNTPLIAAAWRGHKKIVDKLILAGAEKELQDNRGNTALLVAAGRNHVEIVTALLSAKADLEIKNHNGDTALLVAAIEGNHTIVGELITAHANIEAKNNNENTALILASGRGLTGIVSKYPNPSKEHLKIVNTLLSSGANIESKNNSGNTALDTAYLFNHEAAAEAIVLASQKKSESTSINSQKDVEIAETRHTSAAGEELPHKKNDILAQTNLSQAAIQTAQQSATTTAVSSASPQSAVQTLQNEIITQLHQHQNYPVDFKTAVTKMATLIVDLHKSSELPTDEANSLMNLTKALIENPKRHYEFLTAAKSHQAVAGGKLSACMMLVAGCWLGRKNCISRL